MQFATTEAPGLIGNEMRTRVSIDHVGRGRPLLRTSTFSAPSKRIFIMLASGPIMCLFSDLTISCTALHLAGKFFVPLGSSPPQFALTETPSCVWQKAL